MIRLIGILTGSALGIALLILAFGLPDLAPSEQVDDTEAVDRPSPPVEPAEAQPVEEVVSQPPEDIPPQEEPAVAISAPLAEAPVEAAVRDPLPVEERPVETPATQNWYAFWSPFRSRIAADGFVAELQRTTGLDYRVVKLKPGIYEVAFAYTDDADIQDKLTRISAATGMDMSGG